MSFLRKLARRKAPSSLPGPSSQEGATDLATSDDIATQGPLRELPPIEGQNPTTQTEYCAPDRSGHRYDRVQIGGESRNHLGDVYNRNVTYNYGAPFTPSRSTEKQGEDDDARRREVTRLEAERRLEEEKRVASEHRREFLQALRFDVMDSRQATIGLAHKDTCTWIVEAPEYVRWRDESCLPEHHGVLWIKGNPGCGKSTLMKYALDIAQEREDGDTIASFLFNARGQSLEKSAEGMYRSLLYQVLSKLPHLYTDRTHTKQQTWSIELLETMLQTIILALRSDEHLIFYIDALDECVQHDIRDVVGSLEALTDLAISRGLRFSICLSSRHYPHITMHKFVELRLDNLNDHLEDISKYVHSNVGRLCISIAIRRKIETDIERRSSGIFLWVILAIKLLREKRDNGASISELVDSLATVPDRLEDLFAQILENAGSNTIAAFQWLLYGWSTKGPMWLYFAIKTSTNQLITGEHDENEVDMKTARNFILCSTLGLVEVLGSRVRFIHESVREYLLDGGLADLTGEDQRTIKGRVHAQLAQSCLSYVQLASSTHLQCSGVQRAVPRSELDKFPLLETAVDEVFYHMELAYEAGALALAILSELPLRLLVRATNRLNVTRGDITIGESATILYLLLHSKHYSLAEALLTSCSRTENPGIFKYGAVGESAIILDINAYCGPHPPTVLDVAVMDGNSRMVQLLLEHDAEVMLFGPHDTHLLASAVMHGFEDVVKVLLQHGADVNFADGHGMTALEAAVAAPSYSLMSLLLDHGADFNFTGGRYGSILGAAVVRRCLAWSGKDCDYDRIIRLLVDRGAQVNHWRIKSPLWAAADFLNVEMVHRLLDLGADIDAREESPAAGDDTGSLGATALYNVALKNHPAKNAQVKATFDALLKGGADVNVVCKPHGTPLIAAAESGNYDIVSILIAHGADLRYRGDFGTALDVALHYREIKLARLLWSAHFPAEERSQAERRFDIISLEFNVKEGSDDGESRNSSDRSSITSVKTV